MEESDMYLLPYAEKKNTTTFSPSTAKKEASAKVWKDKYPSPNQKSNNSKHDSQKS